MPPLRLLVITARYPTADRPSAGSFVRDRLADPGVEATVVAPDGYAQPGWRRYIGLVWRAMTVRGRFDGVEGHFVIPSGVVALLAARWRRLPLVVFAHGSDVRDMAQRSRTWRWLAQRVVRGADAVIANSEATAAAVRALGAQAAIVNPGVDLARFAAVPPPSNRRILYLGGASAVKGADIARTLADTVLGPGIREVDSSEVPALMAEHGVVLVPSRAEGFGLVAAESIAAGRWVVAADVGGLREVVTDGINGTLVSDGDFASAVAAVPAYDATAVAATADRFAIQRSWAASRGVWNEVLRRLGTGGARSGVKRDQ